MEDEDVIHQQDEDDEDVHSSAASSENEEERAQRMDEEKRLRIRPAPPTSVTARPHDASALAPLGRHVWGMVVALLDASSLRALGASCWAFYALIADGEDALWESRFAAEKPAGVYLVQTGIERWKHRYFAARLQESFASAIGLAREGETVVLTPGRHEVRVHWWGLRIGQPLHILGCGYNRRHRVNLAWNHPSEVPDAGEGSVVIWSTVSNTLDWEAPGGSIRNCDVRYTNSSRDNYYYGVSVRAGGHVEMHNCAISSTQHTAMCVADGSAKLFGCRLHHNMQAGLTLLKGGVVAADGCLFDNNYASGVENVNGSVTLTDCIMHSNLAGVGCNGELHRCKVSGCNIFSNKLNGIEILDAEAVPDIQRCNVHDCLHGIIAWRSSNNGDADVAEWEQLLARNNVLHGNLIEDVKVRVKKEGQTLVDAAIEAGVCTFSFTGPHFNPHVQYACRTCGFDGMRGTCVVCSERCHQGHDVYRVGPAEGFFCDCGFENPNCSFRTVVKDNIEAKRTRLLQSSK